MKKKSIKSTKDKSSKKKTAKKKKYKVSKKLSMDDIYKVINRVQLSRKESKFSVEIAEAATIENVIKDLEMPYERIDLKTKITFIIFPGPEIEEEEEIDFDMEFFRDEQVEDGKLF